MQDSSLKIHATRMQEAYVLGIYKKTNPETSDVETYLKLIKTISNGHILFALVDSTNHVKIVSTGEKQIKNRMLEIGYKLDRNACLKYQETQYRKIHRASRSRSLANGFI